MKNKKILYIGNDIPNNSAAAIRVFSNALALKKYGFSVDILSLDHNYSGEKEEIFKEIRIFRKKYPISKTDYLNYIFDIKKYISVCKGYDCVIAYELPSIATYRLFKWCKKNKIRFICDCAEWHTANHLSGLSKIVKIIDVWLCMNIVYKKCDGLILISSYLKKHFKNNKSIIVPPLQYEKSNNDTLNRMDGITSFIYAGKPDADKDDLKQILDVITTIESPFIFNIYGTNNDKYEIDDQRIHFWGSVPHEMVLDSLRNSDFQIIIREPTRRNNAGFPTKFAESIYNGVPVIVSNFSDVHYYVDTYKIGIKVTEEYSLAQAIQYATEMSNEDIVQFKTNCNKCQSFKFESYINNMGLFIKKICKK